MAPFPSPTKLWHDNTYPTLSPDRPELSAKGKSVIVTGGGTGIGAETARFFAKAGASRIALLGRRQQPLLDTKETIKAISKDIEVFTASTDIGKKAQVDQAFQDFAKGGKIDILISNAAVSGPSEPIKDVDTVAWMDGVNTNISGSLHVAQAFVHVAASNAVVVDINSSASHMHFGPAFSSYSVAKWAVFRLWDCVATANPEMNIFHLQPGIVDTDMNRQAGGVAAFGFEDHVSLPASFSLWLASPEARFLKNKFLWSNWDVDELKSKADEIGKSQKYDIGLVGWPFGEDDWFKKYAEKAPADSKFQFN